MNASRMSLVAWGILACLPVQANAQSCETVYQDAVRNLEFTQRDYTNLHAIFDHQCRSNGEVNEASFSSSASLVIDFIPLDFTGDAQTVRQKTENFCRNYREIRFSDDHVQIAKS